MTWVAQAGPATHPITGRGAGPETRNDDREGLTRSPDFGSMSTRDRSSMGER